MYQHGVDRVMKKIFVGKARHLSIYLETFNFGGGCMMFILSCITEWKQFHPSGSGYPRVWENIS